MRNYFPDVLKKRNCLYYLCARRRIGYISTIGVIDEFRRCGLGKVILDRYISLVKDKCIAICLHVIEHNEAAIKFYFKNNFIEGVKDDKHYFIRGAYYAARAFIALFDSLEKEQSNGILIL